MNIDHGTRRVAAFVEEGLSAADVLGYLENIAAAGAMPYAKLFDATAAKATMSVDELKAIDAWVRNYAMQGRGPVGPLAIVVSSANHLEAAHFADAAGSIRSLRIFRDKTEATSWLVLWPPSSASLPSISSPPRFGLIAQYAMRILKRADWPFGGALGSDVLRFAYRSSVAVKPVCAPTTNE
ncbi:MAG: hypothetical protein AB7F22_18625 [Reyranella sp.]|uniref:hypothetical protein n=1 Tax=Reyranella sp. TaxID=1929291 RepID=UPI003D10E052